MSRSSSQNNRSRRRKADEREPLLTSTESRTPSVAASYRSFPEQESWSTSSSTITPAHLQARPGIDGQIPEPTLDPEDNFESYSTETEGLLPSTNTPEIGRARAVFMVLSLCVLLFLQASNISLLTTVQGVIAEDLNAYDSTTWFMSSYLLAMSSTGPVYGKLSYIFGARYIILIASVVLGIGSVCSATSRSVAPFLVGRVLGGVGAAGIVCVTQVLIQYAPTKRKGLAQGALNTGYTSGVASGAILAGLIQPALGWRAIFWLQLPLTIVSGITLFFAIPRKLKGLQPYNSERDDLPLWTKVARIDYLGATLLISTITLLLYGLASPGFGTVEVLTMLVSLVVLLPAFIYQEAYRHIDPIVPIKVLRNIPVLFSCLATLGYMMSRWAVLFYTPVYGTAVRGLPPAEAGAVLVPTNVGFALGSLLSGLIHIRRDGSFYASCLVIFTIFPVTILWLAFSTTATISLALYWFILLVNGLCAGAGMNYTLAHIQHLVHTDVRLIVISIFFTFRGFAGTFGATVGGGIFNRALKGSLKLRFHQAHLKISDAELRRLVGSPRSVQELHGLARSTAIQGYVDALRALFLAGVGLAIVTLFLQACTGWKGAEDVEKERQQADDQRNENGGVEPSDTR